ncbi:MAG: ABC transporter ATP-binding protein [Methylobacterium sp.]|nr:ABC transporter ATP-binding protein [Methylobacterium sp.]MCA3654930.1 ABC transporter ATP-binding protein [Methylobacterium sp.]MCA3657491.1 ABC transporter ATP-binding protein [Methylobacterium sp.]MCA3664196.1 ABC transporter ATP-binding protein [Methylobacterium sp.]MCA3665416.1 ABC transporter ATP-binding protein [Methylobacterium sp.]
MLRVEHLRIRFRGTPILRDLSFAIDRGEALGLVGESGSGKSMAALAIMGLLPPGMEASGRILLDGEDLLALDEASLCSIRGRRIGMIFQEPMTALNPVHRIGEQIAEPLVLHGVMEHAEALREAESLLERVGIEEPCRRLHSYPHELSGGQRQRVMIAMAMACKPALLIADEPTSALDVTVQSEILDLLRDLRLQEGMATLFISHDLAVIARVARHTLVLYGGAAMETGDTIALLRQPRHPYTQGLLAALPHGRSKGTRLQPIPGFVPPARLLAEGCPFHGRCPRGDARCAAEQPPLTVEHTRAWCFHPGRVE